MSKHGWPRCLFESLIFWIVIAPALSFLTHLLSNNFETENWTYIWATGGGFDFGSVLGISMNTLFLAAMLRHGRKELFDK
jgi:hypothetical protein